MAKFKINDRVMLPSGKIIKILDILSNNGLYQYEVETVIKDILGLLNMNNNNNNESKKYIDIKRVDEKCILKL
jgi:hypothetical protein